MTDQEANRLHKERVKLQRMAQSRETMPDWATEEGDWKGLLYGLAIAIGSVAVIVGLLRWIL